MKNVDVQVNIQYLKSGNIIEQIFTIQSPKKYYKYMLDERFSHHEHFYKKIREYSLVNKSGNIEFSTMRYTEDGAILIYNLLQDDIGIDLKNTIFVVSATIPDTPGCKFCKFNDNEDIHGFIRCSFLEKTITKAKKTCKFFVQKDIIKT